MAGRGRARVSCEDWTLFEGGGGGMGDGRIGADEEWRQCVEEDVSVWVAVCEG